jgi:hypothetical protein
MVQFFVGRTGRALLLLVCGLAVGPSGAAAQVGGVAASAEPTYWDATVVTADGDSLTGQVAGWPWSRTPRRIQFRPEASAAPTTYAPAALRSVTRTDGTRRLVRRSVQIDQVPSDPEAATAYLRSDRPARVRDTLLLEVVVEGPLSLYTVQGRPPPRGRAPARRRSHHFVDAGGTIVELIQRRRYVSSERAVQTIPRYRQQLAVRMDDCSDVRAKVATLPFDLNRIRALVADYNRCVDGASRFVQEEQRTFATSFGVLGGVSREQFALSTRQVDGFDVFGWGTGYRLGAAVTTRVLRGAQRWTLRLELAGARHRIEAGGDGPAVLRRALGPEDFVEATRLETGVFARYDLATPDWRPYLEAGVTGRYLVAFDADTPLRIRTGVTGDRRSLEGYVTDRLGGGERFTPGAVLGTGVTYGPVEVGFRAEWSTLWASYTNFKSRLVTVGVTAGYNF